MQWLSSWAINIVIPVQILHETVCISHVTNIFEKGVNPTILSSAFAHSQNVSVLLFNTTDSNFVHS